MCVMCFVGVLLFCDAEAVIGRMPMSAASVEKASTLARTFLPFKSVSLDCGGLTPSTAEPALGATTTMHTPPPPPPPVKREQTSTRLYSTHTPTHNLDT